MTRKEFLAAYREEMRDPRFTWRRFSSEAELDRFLAEVEYSIDSVKPHHFAKSVAARVAWRNLGGLGALTIARLRRLPLE